MEDLGARVLDLARSVAGPSAEVEVIVTRHDLALTRFANSYIHQNVADTGMTVRLRLHRDGRTAGGMTTLVDDAGLRAMVERTVGGAGLLPVDPGWPGLAPPAPLAGAGNVDDATAAAAPAERAQRVRDFVDAAGGLETAGYCRTTTVSALLVNSAGQSVSGAYTQAALAGVARVDGSDGSASASSVALADVDGARLGARAAAKARAGVDPVEVPPGRYEVVLEYGAADDLLTTLAAVAFNGRSVLDRQSFVEVGAAQFDAAVTLVDDATAPEAVGLPFDAEGTPKQRVEFVRDGVTAAVAHDRRTAAEAGTTSTGSATGEPAFGAVPVNLALAPGDGEAGAPAEVDGPVADSAVAALVAGVERGLLVTDFWYTRVLDPRSLVVTGLTRNGVWLVEGGEVAGPVRNMRFTQSYAQALAPGQVAGVGTAVVGLPGEDWFFTATRTPAVRLASWNFTGGASG